MAFESRLSANSPQASRRPAIVQTSNKLSCLIILFERPLSRLKTQYKEQGGLINYVGDSVSLRLELDKVTIGIVRPSSFSDLIALSSSCVQVSESRLNIVPRYDINMLWLEFCHCIDLLRLDRCLVLIPASATSCSPLPASKSNVTVSKEGLISFARTACRRLSSMREVRTEWITRCILQK